MKFEKEINLILNFLRTLNELLSINKNFERKRKGEKNALKELFMGKKLFFFPLIHFFS